MPIFRRKGGTPDYECQNDYTWEILPKPLPKPNLFSSGLPILILIIFIVIGIMVGVLVSQRGRLL